MNIKIGFCGASGTGKTTLARAVSAEFGLDMNPVGSRSVADEMGFDSPYDVDKAGARREFQLKLQLDKIEWEREHDSFVTDRTTIDDMCYSLLHDHRIVDKEFMRRAQRHVSNYDVIFYTPVKAFCNLAGDPARLHDMSYQIAFDFMARGVLDDWYPDKFISLMTSSLRSRRAMVLRVVEDLIS